MSEEPKELNQDSQQIEFVEDLDATGLYCPEPVMLLHNRIRDIAVGEALRLTATDPSTTRDVPKFCLYLGHELVENLRQGNNYVYLIRKKGES
jgi:tRNA 2-thiouridine synthesizing protein A